MSFEVHRSRIAWVKDGRFHVKEGGLSRSEFEVLHRLAGERLPEILRDLEEPN